MTQFYSVDTSNKYVINVTRYNSIEDVPDDFMTEEEIQEQFGLDYVPTGRTVLRDKVAEQVTYWKGQIPAGKKSIIIKDEELIDALKASYQPISHYAKGVRRVGDRLFLHEKATEEVATKRHHQMLINMLVHTAHTGKKFILSLTYSRDNYAGSMILAKRFVDSWEDIKFFEQTTEHERAMMKQVWDNPHMFD